MRANAINQFSILCFDRQQWLVFHATICGPPKELENKLGYPFSKFVDSIGERMKNIVVKGPQLVVATLNSKK